MGVKNAPCEFSEDGNIPDGANMFRGSTLSQNNYEVGGSGRYNFPLQGQEAGGPLTLRGQFALRSELGELIRIARIARPYDYTTRQSQPELLRLMGRRF